MSAKAAGGHIDAIHETDVVVEWRNNDHDALMDRRVVPKGRLIRSAIIDIARGANFAEGDTITVKAAE